MLVTQVQCTAKRASINMRKRLTMEPALKSSCIPPADCPAGFFFLVGVGWESGGLGLSLLKGW